MFGTFHGEPQKEPTVYLDRDLQKIMEKAADKEPVEEVSDDGSPEAASEKPSDQGRPEDGEGRLHHRLLPWSHRDAPGVLRRGRGRRSAVYD